MWSQYHSTSVHNHELDIVCRLASVNPTLVVHGYIVRSSERDPTYIYTEYVSYFRRRASIFGFAPRLTSRGDCACSQRLTTSRPYRYVCDSNSQHPTCIDAFFNKGKSKIKPFWAVSADRAKLADSFFSERAPPPSPRLDPAHTTVAPMSSFTAPRVTNGRLG